VTKSLNFKVEKSTSFTLSCSKLARALNIF
jgi:hypothetical protein